MAALLADAQLVLAILLVTDAGNLTALGANEIDVGGVDGSLLRNDAALLVGSVGLNGLLDDRNAFDNDLVLGGESTQDNALLAAILTRENLDLIALLDLHISPLTTGSRERARRSSCTSCHEARERRARRYGCRRANHRC